jgi:hypothetical protein
MSRISKFAQYGVFAIALAAAPLTFAQTDQGQATSAPQPQATPGTGANGAATVPPAAAQTSPYNDNANAPNNNGGGHNFGWIGLVGLLGLIGLKPRGARTDTTITRDDRVNPRV